MGAVRFTVSVETGALVAAIEKSLPVRTARLCEAVLADCEKYVPYRTGYLCRSGHVSVGNSPNYGEVVWSAPYASECYYAEREFSHRTHPLACSRWFEAAKGEKSGEWTEAVGNRQ